MTGDYEFTSDWFSHSIPHWEKLLESFVGQPSLRFLEVGSHEGRSALWLIEHILTHPTAVLTCVDPWHNPEIERRFDRNIAASARSNQVQKLKSTSARALPQIAWHSLDFAYIDGSHEGTDVLLDGLLALKLLRRGGLLVFDDYRWNPPDSKRHHPPQPAIDALLELNDWRLTEVHRGWQIVVRVDRW